MIKTPKYHLPRNFFSGLILTCLTIGYFLGSAKAQNSEQLYRVHFKDRTFFTGIIIEKVVDDYLTLITLGGNEVRIEFDVVERIEEIGDNPSPNIYRYLAEKAKKKKQELKEIRRKNLELRRKNFVNGSRNKGYFALIQYITGYAHMGVTTVHGYKFNQYLSVGAGLGFDGVQRPISFRPHRFSSNPDNAMGMHFPFFLYLGGDILKKRTSPYYGFEIGYAYVPPMKSLLDLETRNMSPHGLSVATSFGVKFNTHRRYHTNVGLKLTYRGREMTFRELMPDGESNLYYLEFNKVMTSSWFLGLTVVQGF